MAWGTITRILKGKKRRDSLTIPDILELRLIRHRIRAIWPNYLVDFFLSCSLVRKYNWTYKPIPFFCTSGKLIIATSNERKIDAVVSAGLEHCHTNISSPSYP